MMMYRTMRRWWMDGGGDYDDILCGMVFGNEWLLARGRGRGRQSMCREKVIIPHHLIWQKREEAQPY